MDCNKYITLHKCSLDKMLFNFKIGSKHKPLYEYVRTAPIIVPILCDIYRYKLVVFMHKAAY